MINKPPILTEMRKEVVVENGVVANVNVAPPLLVLATKEAEFEEEIEKSDAKPVVAPAAFETAIVHVITEPNL